MVGQLNGHALGEVEILVSRLQSVVETYSRSTKPFCEDAKMWSHRRSLGDCCDPTFKSCAVWKNRKEAKLAQARQRVRDLRGAACAGVDGRGDEAKANAKSRAEASGAGRRGAKGREKRARAPDAGKGS